MGNERASDSAWLDANEGTRTCPGAVTRANRQAGIVRIFGKVRHRPSASWRQATDRAFTLIGDGRYEDAGALLTRAADLEPWLSESWFNLALLHKFRHDWEQARAAGLRAVALLDKETGAPDWWNVGIAATALQDWPLARRAWQAYGLKVPGAAPRGGGGERRAGRHGARQRRRTAVARGRGRGGLGPQARPGPDRGALHPAAVLRAPLGRGRPARRRAARRAHHQRGPLVPRLRRDRALGALTRTHLGGPAGGRDRGRPGRPGAARRRTPASPPRTGPPRCGCCAGPAPRAGCPAPRARASTSTRTTTASRATRDRWATAPTGDLWSPERECGIAAPAGLVRGLLDGWVADSPDTREWRDLEEVC